MCYRFQSQEAPVTSPSRFAIAATLALFAACEQTPTVPTSPAASTHVAPNGPAPTDVLASSIAFTKGCTSPTNIGAPNTCAFTIRNILASNTLAITSLIDTVHSAGGDIVSGNLLGAVTLVFNGAVSCVGGSGAGTIASPYVGATSCSLPVGTSITTGAFSHYTVQGPDYGLPNHLLTDMGSLTWHDTCSPTSDGCSTADQIALAGSSTLVQQLSSTTATVIHNAGHQTATTIEAGTSVHDFVAVTGQPGNPNPTGSVTIDWFTNSTCLGSATSSSSAAALNASGEVDVTGFNFSPSAGFYAFQARYSGNATYAASAGACEPLRVVDANIQITPATATNTVNTTHTLTGHVNVNDGTGLVNAPAGMQISFNIVSGPGGFTSPNPCTTVGTTGDCTIDLTSAVAGTTTINASVTLSVSGLTLNRQTTGTGGNSAQATKTWVLPNPVVTVTKACPNGKQSIDDRFGVVLNGTATGDVLDCGQSVSLTLQPSTAFNITEGASGNTTNLQNYAAVYSGCSGTGLAAGATSTCTITNTLQPPRSGALSPGYWKNHASQTSALLPISLGNYVVQDFAAATGVFAAMDCGASKDLGVIGCLAGQLLAAKLNVKNGSSNCINSLITQAEAILVAAGYQGPGQPLTTPLTGSQRQTAERLSAKLDRYNNGKGC